MARWWLRVGWMWLKQFAGLQSELSEMNGAYQSLLVAKP